MSQEHSKYFDKMLRAYTPCLTVGEWNKSLKRNKEGHIEVDTESVVKQED